MSDVFIKFPSTPHLSVPLGLEVRGDKVLSPSECSDLLKHIIVVEEKVDGANLGISFDMHANIRIQNRGEYLHLPGRGQWQKLGEWLTPRTDIFLDVLTDRYILFGEWCYAQHSVFYDMLPDWFLGFDVYDKCERRFLSTLHRDSLFVEMDLAKVPTIAIGHFTLTELQALFGVSKYSHELAEGLYIRCDVGDFVVGRAKLIRSSFTQSIGEHWSRSHIRTNQIASDPRSKRSS